MRNITFEHAPPIQQATTCFPDDPHKSVVREDGSLNYAWQDPVPFEHRTEFWKHRTAYHDFGDPGEHFRVRLKPKFTHRDRLVRASQSMEGARVPIIRQVEVYEHTRFEWTIASIRTPGCRADLVVWTLEASADFGHAPSRTELDLIGDPSLVPPIVESLGTTAYWTNEGLQLPGLTHFARLNAGERREGVFAIVLHGKLDPATVTVAWARGQIDQVRAFWNAYPLLKRKISIPDASIQDMLEACARNILQARESDKGVTEYKVGPTMYRSLYMVDGYFLLEAAHMLGDGNLAFQQGILAILRRGRSDGSMQIIPQHYKETGIAIATLVRQCELSGDDSRLTELWPTILRGVDYLRELRRQARELGPDYPGYRLFPPAYLDGGISGPYPDYTTPAWILVGLKFAAEAGRRLGLARIAEIAELFDEVDQGFTAAARRDRKLTPDGIPYVPMIMEHRDFNKPQSATWAFAQAMHPGEVWAPDHEFVRDLLRLLDSVDGEQGIPQETGWIHDQAVWGYSAMFYAQVWLYAGNPGKAIDYLYAFANHATPARVWREEQGLTGSHNGDYCGDMPHNWASAEFIRLVRHAIVLEKAGGLELLAGLPDQWLPRDGVDLLFEDTPTRYGAVTLRLTRTSEGAFALEYRRVPGAVEPLSVVLHWDDTKTILPATAGVAQTFKETLK